MDFKSKTLLTCALIFIGLGLLLIYQSQTLGKLRLIACDVGQGDGLLIISPDGREILIDAGAGSKMVDCLSRYMPFWDREIEMIVPTHPHQEHMEGFLEVLARYKVNAILTTEVPNDTQFYKKWQKALNKEGANIYTPNGKDQFIIDSSQTKLQVLWPTRPAIDRWKKQPPSDLNDTSIVLRLEYGQFCAYLTGDLPKELLQNLIDKPCQVLKVVHHGSRTGTNEKVLEEAKPQLAIIQVGKNNKFGHPHKEVIDLLTSRGVKILRNDINGSIELDSDGKAYQVKSERR